MYIVNMSVLTPDEAGASPVRSTPRNKWLNYHIVKMLFFNNMNMKKCYIMCAEGGI